MPKPCLRRTSCTTMSSSRWTTRWIRSSTSCRSMATPMLVGNGAGTAMRMMSTPKGVWSGRAARAVGKEPRAEAKVARAAAEGKARTGRSHWSGAAGRRARIFGRKSRPSAVGRGARSGTNHLLRVARGARSGRNHLLPAQRGARSGSKHPLPVQRRARTRKSRLLVVGGGAKTWRSPLLPANGRVKSWKSLLLSVRPEVRVARGVRAPARLGTGSVRSRTMASRRRTTTRPRKLHPRLVPALLELATAAQQLAREVPHLAGAPLLLPQLVLRGSRHPVHHRAEEWERKVSDREDPGQARRVASVEGLSHGLSL
mmetsp:Transcript_46679/g.107891  ORF Transcript_46679/g.107891 Transcript_46679/m.107891 type:complete len:314 (-) Transcript_46679:173-1114(-)